MNYNNRNLNRLSIFNKYLIVASFQSLLAQTREKQAVTLSEVTWRGRTVPVKNEQVRAFLLSCQETESQLKKTDEDLESRVSIYETLLMECKDALQIMRDELKADVVSTWGRGWWF